MTTLTTSADYNENLHQRRLFDRVKEHLQAFEKQVEQVLSAGNGMRLSLANGMLAIAEIEALYVDQTDSRRKADSLAHQLQDQITDLTSKLKQKLGDVSADLAARDNTLCDFTRQVDRAVRDRYVYDSEEAPSANVEYVEIDYLADRLKCSKSMIRLLVNENKLDAADRRKSNAGTRGRPVLLWIKSKADCMCDAYLESKTAVSLAA